MKNLSITLILLCASFLGYSEVNPVSPQPMLPAFNFTLKSSLFNADPCLDAALNAQANAFYAEYAGHNFCHNSVLSGSIAASEYGGCAYAFTAIRQATVAYIQSTFVPCPSGNGVGIAMHVKKNIILSDI